MAKYRFEETERKRVVELEDGEHLNIKRNNPLKGLYQDYFIINQRFLKYVIARDLTGRQSKILFYLLSEMANKNRIVTNGRIIGENLGIEQSNILKDLKVLEVYGIIFRQKLGMYQTEIGLNYELVEHDMVNPLMGYKGSANSKFIQEHKEKIQGLTPYATIDQLKEGKVDIVDKTTGEVLYSEKRKTTYKQLDLEEEIKKFEEE